MGTVNEYYYRETVRIFHDVKKISFFFRTMCERMEHLPGMHNEAVLHV